MKKHNIILNVAWMCILLVAFSCNDDEKSLCSGTPVITAVTTTTDRTEELSGGNLADWIIIKGSNFCSVSKVQFNNVEVDLKTAYITSDEITLSIPRKVPTEVTNLITVESSAGSAKYDYTISIPDLIITGMANEYVASGETAVILGKNFDLYGVTTTTGKLFLDNTEVKIVKSTQDSILFEVPDNAASGAVVKLVDSNEIEHILQGGRLRDNRNVLITNDPFAGWTGESWITNGPTPVPVDGNYIYIHQKIGGWAWTDIMGVNVNNFPEDAVLHPENYYFKFEYNCKSACVTNYIHFFIDGAGYNAFFKYEDTYGLWKTISFNLTDIANDGGAVLKPNQPSHAVSSIFHGGGDIDANIAMDNFRVVPKN